LLDQKSNAELQHKLTRTSELEAEVQQLRKAKE
jgi:chromosome segregation ATPase